MTLTGLDLFICGFRSSAAIKTISSEIARRTVLLL